jgi:hypothetical protein
MYGTAHSRNKGQMVVADMNMTRFFVTLSKLCGCASIEPPGYAMSCWTSLSCAECFCLSKLQGFVVSASGASMVASLDPAAQ